MDTFALLLQGLSVAIQPINLLYALVGVTLGTAVGVLPGIGPASAGRALDAMATATDPLGELAAFVPPARAAEDWPAFAGLVESLRGKGAGWPADIEAVRAWYQPHLERSYEDAAVRMADLAQLEQIAAGYASRERFLTELTLDPPSAVSDEAGVPRRK